MSASGILERQFDLKAHHTTVGREVLAGFTTYLALAYIVVVNPAILGATGMDKGAVMVATCVTSAFTTLLMAFMANYPIALAPGMGVNAYFAFTVCIGMKVPWQVALGATFLSGVLLYILTITKLRRAIVEAVPYSIKLSLGVGIGLFITFIGLAWSGLIRPHSKTLVTLADPSQRAALVSLFGLGLTVLLIGRGVRGAILIGILADCLLALALGVTTFKGIVSWPPSLAPTFLAADIRGALATGVLSIIFTFFLIDLFDTLGTLIGVGQRAGILDAKGEMPKVDRALMADAVGTATGGLLGTSTITAYIESAAGIAEGGRTGLTNVVTALCLLASTFFYPLVEMLSAEVTTPGTASLDLRPIVAPALIVVGYFMMLAVRDIPWDEASEGIPAFLTMVSVPLTFNIANGIAVGFIIYTFMKVALGRFRELKPLTVALALICVARFVWLSE
jgi:AGZA family xanthine/uracil permease-like MFS transporter